MSAIPVISVDQFDSLEVDDAVALLRERFRTLVKLGHTIEAAIVIGVHPEVDVHAATRLTRHGCPAKTAVHILR